MVFRLTMNQSSEGDALMLDWGPPGSGLRAVIDLGRTADYTALRPALMADPQVALFVISHVDADHIEGAMPMLKEPTAPFTPVDVWFNGHDQLGLAKARALVLEALSVGQGEKLSAGIRKFGWPWNAAFGGGPVSTGSPEAADPIALVGGLSVRLLSPSDAALAKLEPEWNALLAKSSLLIGQPDQAPLQPKDLESLSILNVDALAAERYAEDSTVPNGTCIAFLAEFGAKRVLLGADAHPRQIEQALTALGCGPQNRVRLDLFKLCHHGSKANLSPALLTLIDCTRFAISTDGSRHNHPDPQTIARILKADPSRPKTFYFNTRQEHAEQWDRADLRAKWAYTCVFPDPPATAGLTIEV